MNLQLLVYAFLFVLNPSTNEWTAVHRDEHFAYECLTSYAYIHQDTLVCTNEELPPNVYVSDVIAKTNESGQLFYDLGGKTYSGHFR